MARGKLVAALGATLLAALTVLGMFGCFIAAIWTHGPDLPSRLAGTGAVLFSLSWATVPAAIFAWEAATNG